MDSRTAISGHFPLRPALGWVLLLIAILVAGCSEPNKDGPLPAGVHPGRWNDTRFWQSGPFHGDFAVSQGTGSCLPCHGADLLGFGDIPGCFTCHFGPGGGRAPQGSDWVHGPERHEEFQSHLSVCNACHDTARKFSTDPDPCHDCHGAGIDHPLGQPWLDRNDPQFHGDVSRENCAACHNLAQKCSECHFGATGSLAPPGTGWNHGNNDAHQDHAVFAATCNRCHDIDRSFGNGPVDCHDCHGIDADHVFGQAWLDKKSSLFHGDQPLDNCTDCHVPAQKCFECHFGADGSQAPPGTAWNHGNNDAHREYSAYETVCNRCHTLNRSYGNGPDRCHDCHKNGDD